MCGKDITIAHAFECAVTEDVRSADKAKGWRGYRSDARLRALRTYYDRLGRTRRLLRREDAHHLAVVLGGAEPFVTGPGGEIVEIV